MRKLHLYVLYVLGPEFPDITTIILYNKLLGWFPFYSQAQIIL